MISDNPHLTLKLAATASEIRAAQRLRYEVFVAELGGDGPLVDHGARLERDRLDADFDHLLLIDDRLPAGGNVVGVYRLLRGDQAARIGGFYSAGEYDLAPLLGSGRRLLELGRSCLAPGWRGGAGMYHLWQGLADYVARHGIELLFGVASFHGTEPEALALPLSWLYRNHLAPEGLRVRSLAYQPMDLLAGEVLDRRAAMVATPALIKAYLRLGGFVGDGAFVDHDFNTTDVCLVMDTARLDPRHAARYRRGQAG